MKVIEIGIGNTWYYGKVGDIIPVKSMYLCDDEYGQPVIEIITYDGDSKPNKPFGDEYVGSLDDMEVKFYDFDESNTKEEIKESIDNDNYGFAFAMLKIVNAGLIDA